jgi:hypothetical protein
LLANVFVLDSYSGVMTSRLWIPQTPGKVSIGTGSFSKRICLSAFRTAPGNNAQVYPHPHSLPLTHGKADAALAPPNVLRTAPEIPFYVIAGGFFTVGSFLEEGLIDTRPRLYLTK